MGPASVGRRIVPEVDVELCTLCGDCISNCSRGAVAIILQEIVIDGERCDYCGDCEDVCPMGAITLSFAIVLSTEDGLPGG